MPKRSFTVASPHVVYRSDQLEKTQGVAKIIDDLLLKNFNNSELLEESTNIGIENNETINETFRVSGMFPTELREVEVLFHLFTWDLFHSFTLKKKKREDFNTHAYEGHTLSSFQESYEVPIREALRRDVQPVERAILASLFLNKNLLDELGKKIHNIVHRTMYLMIRDPSYDNSSIDRASYFISPSHWRIPILGLPSTGKVSFLGLEMDAITVNDLRINLDSLTESYYHINKNELMERVKYLLCRGLFDNEEPENMEQVEELYDRLLNYKGATMWETASLQFPEDEVVFLWNRSIIDQSLKEAWNLPLTPERVNDSIPNFKVTHCRNVRDGDRLIPIMDAEVWTNDQLRDALGYDWMFDQRLMLQTRDWIINRRDVDLRMVRERLTDIFSAYHSQIDDNQGRIIIKTNYDQLLWLREFSPEQALRNNEELVLDNDEKEEFIELGSSESSLDERNSETELRKSLRREKEVLRMENERLDREDERLRRERERLDEASEKLRRERERLIGERERLWGVLESRNGVMKSVRESVFGLDGEYEKLRRERERLIEEREKLRGERERLDREDERLDGERERLIEEGGRLDEKKESWRERRTNLFLRERQLEIPIDRNLITAREVQKILSQVEPETLEAELTNQNLEEESFEMLSQEDKLEFILSLDKVNLDMDNDGLFVLSYKYNDENEIEIEDTFNNPIW